MRGACPANRRVDGAGTCPGASTENRQIFFFYPACQPGRRVGILRHHDNTGCILIQPADRPGREASAPSGAQCGKYVAQRIVLMLFHRMAGHVPGLVEHNQRFVLIQHRNSYCQWDNRCFPLRPAQGDLISSPYQINRAEQIFTAEQAPGRSSFLRF